MTKRQHLARAMRDLFNAWMLRRAGEYRLAFAARARAQYHIAAARTKDVLLRAAA
jgi:hypothetical protein